MEAALWDDSSKNKNHVIDIPVMDFNAGDDTELNVSPRLDIDEIVEVIAGDIIDKSQQYLSPEIDIVVNPNDIHEYNEQYVPNSTKVGNRRYVRVNKNPKYQDDSQVMKFILNVAKAVAAIIIISRFNSPSLTNHNSLLIAISVSAIMMGFTTNLASLKLHNKNEKISTILRKIGLACTVFGCLLSISLFLPPELEWIALPNAIVAGFVMLI